MTTVDVVPAVFYFGNLFYPTPLFTYAAWIGRYHLYADVRLPAGMSRVIEDVAVCGVV